jgi:hypothetical protein
MGYVEKRYGGYRVRYKDPNGRLTSRTFPRKTDADRFLREMEVEVSRGLWVDPRDADMPLEVWAETFLSMARRLSPSTQMTYRRDLETYVFPRFGKYARPADGGQPAPAPRPFDTRGGQLLDHHATEAWSSVRRMRFGVPAPFTAVTGLRGRPRSLSDSSSHDGSAI